MMRFFDRWAFGQGLDALINVKPKDKEKLISKIQEIAKAIDDTNKLPSLLLETNAY